MFRTLLSFPRRVRNGIRRWTSDRVFFIRNRKQWRGLIAGKSVAIVGPAPLDGDYSEEIESCDVIIRVGYEHWPWPNTGSRTDVWVLDGGGSIDLLSGRLQERQATWFLLKAGWDPESAGVSFMNLVKMRTSKSGASLAMARIPIRRNWPYEPRPENINLNQVPVVLLELLLLAPSKVSVYGSDFYTRPGQSYGTQSPDFKLQSAEQEKFITVMLHQHDQQLQRLVIRAAQQEFKVFGGDRLFLKLLWMADQDFESLFSEWRGV